MATVQIKEGDQLILSCDLREIATQNEFIRSLVADAQAASDGMAEREDGEGCLVTAVVFESAKAKFRFATDSEVGTIEAATFSDACDKLDAMLPEQAIESGAFGWVEDVNGHRYRVGY